MQKAKDFNMPAAAITDHGNMFGAIDFYQAAIKNDIKPIIGMETYIINGSIYSKEDKSSTRHHLTLLAKNRKGYDNLAKLSSFAYIDGFYYKPRIDKNILQQHSEGLIGLGGCRKGEIQHLLLSNKYEQAIEAIHEYQEIFGADDFYLELMRLGMEDDEKLIRLQQKASKETGAEVVATNDNHYLNKEDSKAHDVLLCIQTGKLITDDKRMKFSTDQVYFRSSEEMENLFEDIPEAIENTKKIADKCNLKLEFTDFLLPRIDSPPDFESQLDYLEHLVEVGAKKKYKEITPEVKERINFELKTIKNMGFVGYFLITRDIVKAARDMGVMVGPGRGSAAGSIIAYLLDITRVNPLEYDLLFERFLNPARISMPDIDIDFSAQGRSRVLDYIIDKYGRDNVCQIITLGSLGAKMVVRDVGRAMDIPLNEVDTITKRIPSSPGIKLEEALQRSNRLRKLVNSKKEYKQLFEYSKVLEGLPRHSGVHAAGVVITPGNLTDYIPLAKNIKEDALVTQYEGKWLETLKMLKMDILGLKNLTVIEKTLKSIKKNHDKEIDIETIDQNDIKTYELLCHGDTAGVFQFEGEGMKDVLQQIKPSSIDDLAACTALYRPGTLGSGMHKVFINRKNGKEDVSYLHPMIEDILEPTYGVIVYQEQVMQIANKLAGLTLSEADTLRKAMGKKKKKIMTAYKPKFIKGAVNNGVSEKKATEIYELIEKFGQYGFNKSHSVAYSIISYQTAYLKANYPTEYMAALMSVEKDSDKIAKFIHNCEQLNITVVAPDINKSEYDFKAEGDKIYYGLKAIKNVGKNTIKAIVAAREKNGNFTNMFELCEKTPNDAINKTALECLIASGSMDNLSGNRAEKYEAIQTALQFGANIHAENSRGQESLFSSFKEDENFKQYPGLETLADWSINYKLTKEKELLGRYFSGHPLLDKKFEIEKFTNFNTKDGFTSSARNSNGSTAIRIIGLLNKIVTKKDKNGNEMAFLELEDLYDKFEVIVFSSLYQHFTLKELSEDKILYLVCKKSNRQGENINDHKFIATDIIPIENLQNELAGEMYLLANEKHFNRDKFDLLLKSYLSKTSGNFNIHLKLETDKFGILDIISQKYKSYPTLELQEHLSQKQQFVDGIKVVFNED